MDSININGPPLTIRRILCWMLFFAAFCAIFSVLPATNFSFGAASITACLFILADACLPRFVRASVALSVSFFACALAYAVGVAFLSLHIYPLPVAARPPLPFWYLVTGGVVREILIDIARVIAIVVYYIETIVACTLVSCLVAVFTARRHYC
jgi:hypothetical protein